MSYNIVISNTPGQPDVFYALIDRTDSNGNPDGTRWKLGDDDFTATQSTVNNTTLILLEEDANVDGYYSADTEVDPATTNFRTTIVQYDGVSAYTALGSSTNIPRQNSPAVTISLNVEEDRS